jgi:hypothetical protein
MGLTSPGFTWFMTAVAVAALALLIWSWPRLGGAQPGVARLGGAPAGAGRGWPPLGWWLRALPGRLAALAVTQAVVVAAFLVWLNSYFVFYASWAQLLGMHPVAAVAANVAAGTARTRGAARRAVASQVWAGRADAGQVRAGRPAARSGAWPGGLVTGRPQPGPAPWHGAVPLAAPRGRVSLPAASRAPAAVGELVPLQITGQRTGLSSGPGFAYLPPQYFQPAYARTRFPVVLALTGYPGDASDIVHQLGLPALAARLIAAGRIRPAVFVMLNVSPLMPMDTECTDVPGGPQTESFFAEDVPRAVEAAFRVTSSAQGWGVIGYSTGGYCAAKLTMMYPARFSAGVSMAGYYNAEWGFALHHQWGGSAAYRDENSLFWRLRHLPAPPVSLLVTSSWAGERSLPGTLAFLRVIHPPMRGYSLIVPQGGHNFRTWARELPGCLEWLSQRLR